MTAFVESCIGTLAGSARAVARQTRGKPKARHLLRLLKDKQNVLITTHAHPDPDALGSSLALCRLLQDTLPDDTRVNVAIQGHIGGGLNEIFVQQAGLRPLHLETEDISAYDAVILLDTQPPFTNNPLPADVTPVAVIDHHRRRGRKLQYPFRDIRSDVGATTTIIFSYFMELEVPISHDLAAAMLFAIESDLAGAAGQPGELDNLALSSLTLVADTRKLYKMRYAPLPRNYFIAYAQGFSNAVIHDTAVVSHLDRINSPEKPAVIADFLLRFERAKWALVTAVRGETLVLSLRTNDRKNSAADLMRKLIRDIGEGGGHRTKAGGEIPLASGTPAEIDRLRSTLRRRCLRALGISVTRGERLVPRTNDPRP